MLSYRMTLPLNEKRTRGCVFRGQVLGVLRISFSFERS